MTMVDNLVDCKAIIQAVCVGALLAYRNAVYDDLSARSFVRGRFKGSLLRCLQLSFDSSEFVTMDGRIPFKGRTPLTFQLVYISHYRSRVSASFVGGFERCLLRGFDTPQY